MSKQNDLLLGTAIMEKLQPLFAQVGFLWQQSPTGVTSNVAAQHFYK